MVAPAYPMLQDDDGGVTDLSESGGAIGIMFNGVALFRYRTRRDTYEYCCSFKKKTF